jgi:restriction system protein
MMEENMARRSGFSGLMAQVAREQARAQRERERQERARLRDLERQRREATRQATVMQKEAKQAYLESRLAETEDRNTELSELNMQLASVLSHTIDKDDTIVFDSLRIDDQFRDFVLPRELAGEIEAPRKEQYMPESPAPGRLKRLIPGAVRQYEVAVTLAEEQFHQAVEEYQRLKEQRADSIQKLRQQYDAEKKAYQLKVQQRNAEVDELERSYQDRVPDAVCTYCTMVLERSEYPDGFPQEYRLAYLPQSKEIVVEYRLPDIAIVPVVAEYRYLKSKDSIDGKARKPVETREMYQDVIASICLRTIHELVESDQADVVDVVVFNGFVETTDPATGQDIRPHLISVRTTKVRFREINLARIDKRICLRNLGAQVSPRPYEMLAVKPVLQFDMVDKRFVEQSDILADLEARPNLMELTPFEFENLVTNLFESIGFQAKQTRSSRDGGVDAIAFDPRPILGGKVVIQAKRYRNVVGVSAVRDLYGTMINEGANKGILVTTSHYGPDAYDFASDKPIELIDGGGLLYLLEQNGIHARVIFPEE